MSFNRKFKRNVREKINKLVLTEANKPILKKVNNLEQKQNNELIDNFIMDNTVLIVKKMNELNLNDMQFSDFIKIHMMQELSNYKQLKQM